MTKSSSELHDIEPLREIPEIEPMGVRAAIESMKILLPYRDLFEADQTLGKAIRQMLRKAMSRSPLEMLRLLALMYHKDIDDIAEDYELKAGPHFVVAIAHGFDVNNVLGLIRAAEVLGLSEEGEADGGI